MLKLLCPISHFHSNVTFSRHALYHNFQEGGPQLRTCKVALSWLAYSQRRCSLWYGLLGCSWLRRHQRWRPSSSSGCSFSCSVTSAYADAATRSNSSAGVLVQSLRSSVGITVHIDAGIRKYEVIPGRELFMIFSAIFYSAILQCFEITVL